MNIFKQMLFSRALQNFNNDLVGEKQYKDFLVILDKLTIKQAEACCKVLHPDFYNKVISNRSKK